MTTINILRETTSFTATEVVLTTFDDQSGFHLLANGEKVISITPEGYLRRHRGLSAQAGVRLLDDGRIAIKPKADDAA